MLRDPETMFRDSETMWLEGTLPFQRFWAKAGDLLGCTTFDRNDIKEKGLGEIQGLLCSNGKNYALAFFFASVVIPSMTRITERIIMNAARIT